MYIRIRYRTVLDQMCVCVRAELERCAGNTASHWSTPATSIGWTNVLRPCLGYNRGKKDVFFTSYSPCPKGSFSQHSPCTLTGRKLDKSYVTWRFFPQNALPRRLSRSFLVGYGLLYPRTSCTSCSRRMPFIKPPATATMAPQELILYWTMHHLPNTTAKPMSSFWNKFPRSAHKQLILRMPTL